MRLNLKDIILLGLLNFVLFVGAGNLIFPPFIGFMAGPYIWIAVAGFLLTGVGLPVLTSVVVGYVDSFSRPGGYGEVKTPEPIPNSAVKCFSANGTLS